MSRLLKIVGLMLALTVSVRAQEARQVLETAGVKGGLVVCVGAEAKLVADLRAQPGVVVDALPSGRDRLPYADNLVNLLIANVPVLEAEIQRVLVPNGVALVAGKKIVKPWPTELDEWGHWDHGADANPVSQDTRVGPPRQLQWVAGPRFSKQHWGPRISAAVTAQGRFFTVEDDTPTSVFNIADRWMLVARDAFNGVVLWRRELPQWGSGEWKASGRQPAALKLSAELTLGVFATGKGGGARDSTAVMVAAGDRLFMPLAAKAPVSVLDAATGHVVRTLDDIQVPNGVVYAGGLLLVSDAQRTVAVDPETGTQRWRMAGRDVSAKDGRAYLLTNDRQTLTCVELASGAAVWETKSETKFEDRPQIGAGIVLLVSRKDRKTTHHAFAAGDGHELWQMDYNYSGGPPTSRPQRLFIINNQVWLLKSKDGRVEALDPQTGKVQTTVNAPGIQYVGHHARCYHARATSRFIIAKERGAEFVDLASGAVSWNNWVRGPCARGVIPANGLLYAGQHSCRCYSETALRGFYALAPEGAKIADRGPQLEKGPAFESKVADHQSATDWPTYRHDAERSGGTSNALPDGLTKRWSVEIGGRLTAPVVAAGLLYVAAVDEHRLYALDAGTGAVRWEYAAGARIDSPPTIYRGLALLGSHDGWVHCLRADTGVLVWRYRVAQSERLIGAYGQLESAWPVVGSVLIKDNIAYAVAGQSSFLDGGLVLCGLDPVTGAVRHRRVLDGPWPGPEIGTSKETPSRSYVIPGALPDVLVANAEGIFLRELRFDSMLQNMTDLQPSVAGIRGDSKFWDDLAPKGAAFNDLGSLHRTFFNNFPGRRLYTTTGLLDGSWHRRMFWSYGQVVGQYVVFRGEMGYAVRAFEANSREGGHNAGEGYVVYAGRTVEREGSEKVYALRADAAQWRIRVPFRPQAMALAGDRLLLAGPPDLKEPAAALAALEGRQGGTLRSVAIEDGKQRGELALTSPPVFDGLAIAAGKLFLAAMDGQVVCYGER